MCSHSFSQHLVMITQNNEFVASLTDDMSTCEHSMISKMTVSCRQCVISMCELCARLHDPDHDGSIICDVTVIMYY